ncbi:hypothetical protein [Chitinimonas koreensis]|uniref:hypothetical protein n=1 Tax=Chitinimonas koreensis TaxID=356302 RepID=UPI0016543896|nr:hypothetical protein [Chitinimonas koreensis]QNM98197.1 hypothetical protein H9L41_08125 [Chitinimonas koreensis]
MNQAEAHYSDALVGEGHYEEHEDFYLCVAQEAGFNGWELDRLLFNFRTEVEKGA